MDEILAVLAPLQALRHRHQEQLDLHRTADGDVIEEQRTAYEEVRETTAMEASDTLGVVIKRLELLAAIPTCRAFTLAFTGPGHEDGERPWLFVVHATDLHDAQRTLRELPSFQQWLEDAASPSLNAPALLTEESHPGTGAPGSYNDLRHEQASLPAQRAPTQPAAAGTAPFAPTSRPTRRPAITAARSPRPSLPYGRKEHHL
ncbi:hypothetical protein G3I60_39990 [Streptomyces sp. SID13666]|uniref:hypothetical protein n=1 Tax=Streptomyces sp. SID13666 TaxID=2706054 RepID=UPI0013BF5580|nr:hypothetical protein [Streptomyces sp. SID13666]NEA60183.1 hypothetical protein [Streptomyces sp. SID13666]